MSLPSRCESASRSEAQPASSSAVAATSVTAAISRRRPAGRPARRLRRPVAEPPTAVRGSHGSRVDGADPERRGRIGVGRLDEPLTASLEGGDARQGAAALAGVVVERLAGDLTVHGPDRQLVARRSRPRRRRPSRRRRRSRRACGRRSGCTARPSSAAGDCAAAATRMRSRTIVGPKRTTLPSKRFHGSITRGSRSIGSSKRSAHGAADSWVRCSGEAISRVMGRPASDSAAAAAIRWPRSESPKPSSRP